MKTITLNIGLETNDGGKVALHTAILVTNNRFNIIKSRLDVSPNGGEETLVCVVEYCPEFVDLLHEICGLLKQDCIACFGYLANGKPGEPWGELIGPKAESWGQFNHSYFVHF